MSHILKTKVLIEHIEDRISLNECKYGLEKANIELNKVLNLIKNPMDDWKKQNLISRSAVVEMRRARDENR